MTMEEGGPGAPLALANGVQQGRAHRRDLQAEAKARQEQFRRGNRDRQTEEMRPERPFIPA